MRRVSLTAQAIAALCAHHTRRADAAAELGAADADRYVFTSDPSGNRPWRPELVTRRWERIRGTAGLDGVRVHDLRHYVATQPLTAGTDARTVAYRLGHRADLHHPRPLLGLGPRRRPRRRQVPRTPPPIGGWAPLTDQLRPR